ncbi:MAG: DUF2213 domain-containing protein [Candidatus Peribacteraceae bacterium]|nr:DUF2213 domain-containing protein [Candidatus Peribacteraceae bacterium]
MDNKERTNVVISGSVNVAGAKPAELMGKTYTVLPATMMVEGSYYPYIENVSDAKSLFFSAKDLEQSVNTWNGRPVAINHPDGQASCNSPEAYEKQWVGYVFNARYEASTKSLKSDLWIDPERGQFLTSRVSAGENIDVSIGAFGDLSPNLNSTGNYDFKMSNIVGDHLAVLPDGVGACSWQDGCGIRATVYSKEKPVVSKMERTESTGTLPVMQLNNNNTVRGGKMAECEERTVEHVHRVDVEATVKEPEKIGLNQLMDRLGEGDKARLTTALNFQEDYKKKHIEKIVACKSVSVCAKALSRVVDVSLLESISELVALADKAPEEKVVVGASDYQLKAGGGKVEPKPKWAEFTDIDYSSFAKQ